MADAVEAVRVSELLIFLRVPGADETVDAEIVADELVAIINTERERNGGGAGAVEMTGASWARQPVVGR